MKRCFKDGAGNLLNAGTINVLGVSPGIFTANQNRQGVPAAIIVRVRPGNEQLYEPVHRFDESAGEFVPLALDMGPQEEMVFLSLFGTGWRHASPSTAQVTVGGIDCPVMPDCSQPLKDSIRSTYSCPGL